MGEVGGSYCGVKQQKEDIRVGLVRDGDGGPREETALSGK